MARYPTSRADHIAQDIARQKNAEFLAKQSPPQEQPMATDREALIAALPRTPMDAARRDALTDALTDADRVAIGQAIVVVQDAHRAALAAPPVEQQAAAACRTTGYLAPKGRYVPPVLFSPYTGEPRDARDIASDPQGVLIAPPGAALLAAPQPAEPAQPAAQAEPVALQHVAVAENGVLRWMTIPLPAAVDVGAAQVSPYDAFAARYKADPADPACAEQVATYADGWYDSRAAQAETALTEDQWLDLGMRHAGRNLDGSDFLKFIKAVCRDYDAARATPGATHGN